MPGPGWKNDSFDTELLASVFGERFDRLMTVEVRPVTGGFRRDLWCGYMRFAVDSTASRSPL